MRFLIALVLTFSLCLPQALAFDMSYIIEPDIQLLPVSDAGIMPLSMEDNNWTSAQWTSVYNAIVNGQSNLASIQRFLSSSSSGYKSLLQALGYTDSTTSTVFSQLSSLVSDLITLRQTVVTLAPALTNSIGNNNNLRYKSLIEALGYTVATSGNDTVWSQLRSIDQYVSGAISVDTASISSSSSSILAVLQTLQTNQSRSYNLARQNEFSIWRHNQLASSSLLSNLSFGTALQLISVNQITSAARYLDYAGNIFVSSSDVVYFNAADILLRGLVGLRTVLQGTSDLSPFSNSLWSFNGADLVKTSGSQSGGFPMINALLDNLNAGVYQLVDVLANPGEQEIADAAQENRDAFHDNFQGDGAGSVGGGSIKDVAGVSSGASDLFDTGASPGQFFTQVNGNAGGWFSQDVKDSLSYSGPVSLDLDDEDDLTHYYEENYAEFLRLLGGE